MFEAMKKLLIIILFLCAFAFSANGQESVQRENAVLKNALSQALNKLEYFQNALAAANRLIDAQRAEIARAKGTIAQSDEERIKLDSDIKVAENKIFGYQNQIIEFKKQIVEIEKQIEIYKTQVANLELELKREKKKKKFFKNLLIILVPAAIFGGILIGNE